MTELAWPLEHREDASELVVGVDTVPEFAK